MKEEIKEAIETKLIYDIHIMMQYKKAVKRSNREKLKKLFFQVYIALLRRF